MTRAELTKVILQAHDHLHAGEVDEAHELLHTVGRGTQSMTSDPEVQEAVAKFREMADGVMACGHTFGDLIYSPGSITKCGACVASHNASSPQPSPLAQKPNEQSIASAYESIERSEFASRDDA